MLIRASKRARVSNNPESTIVDSRCVSVVSGVVVLGVRFWQGRRGWGGPWVGDGSHEGGQGSQHNGEYELFQRKIR